MKYKKTLAGLGASVILVGGGVVVGDAQINPYTDTGLKMEMIQVNDIPDAGESKIELIKSRPEMRMKKWNGEIDLGISYANVKGTGNRPFLSNKMEWKDEKEEVHAYPVDGGFEFEIILNEKPATNVFDFTIDGAENLDFFYQPELTPQEIAEGGVRPDNVIGSYAVYHKTKANHKVGDINYATGKAFHIYRPKAIDANGVEVWAELNITGGTLIVIIPQKFLDEAVYPVRVDPTFGYTTVGATNNTLSLNKAYGAKGTPVDGDGTVSKVTVHWKYTTSQVNTKFFLTLGSDKSLVTNGVSNVGFPSGTTYAWEDVVFGTSPSVLNNTLYYINVITSADWGTPGQLMAGDTLTANGWFDGTNSYTTPAETSSGGSQNYRFSLYATYTQSGGATPSTDDDYPIIME